MPGSDFLLMWTVYYDPKDYPGKWVVRRWDIGPGTVTANPEAFVCDSLTEARASIPPGLVRFNRVETDEPQIKEIWF